MTPNHMYAGGLGGMILAFIIGFATGGFEEKPTESKVDTSKIISTRVSGEINPNNAIVFDLNGCKVASVDNPFDEILVVLSCTKESFVIQNTK